MVAQTTSQDATTHREDAESFGSEDQSSFDPHNQGGLRRLIVSITRLADIQGRIWITEAKLTVMKIALYAALFGAATLVGILGIIFLFIGIFHVLTDVLGLAKVWAFLIFGGAQILLAFIVALIANFKLSKPNLPKKKRAAT